MSPVPNPYVSGPGLVGARMTRFSPVGDFAPPALSGASPNDALSLYGDDAEFRLRLFTSGGFSPDGVSGFLATDYENFFRLHAVDADGQPVIIDETGKVYDLGVGTVQVVGLAAVGPPTVGDPDRAYDVEDHDNYFDIILKGNEAAIQLLESAEIPTSAEPGYRDIYNPGGLGRTPTPGVVYTSPAAPQTFIITQAVDNPATVSYASQDFASYDLDDDLPVVFRVSGSSGPDRLTADSNEVDSLLATGFSIEAVEFANETARTGVFDVNAFFNPETGDRIYTLDAAESADLAANPDWQHTGRAFGAFDRNWPGAVPVYRFLDTETDWHVFASNLDDVFQTDGVEYRGIGWYAASFVAPSTELHFDRSDDLHLTDALVSDRLLVKDGSGTLSLAGGTLSQGITIRNGRLEMDGNLSGGLLMVEPNGVLAGRGIISNDVAVSGRLAPGSSPGTMTFFSSVDMDSNGILEIEIDGPLPANGANGYDRVIVIGSGNHFAAAGTLDVRLRGITPPATNSFTPALGQRFIGVVTSAGGVTGSFDSLSQPPAGLRPGTRFDTIYGATTLDLVVTPESYGNLAAAGVRQNSNQAAVGRALDMIRPALGVRPTGASAELFPALAPLASSQIPTALDMLSGQVHVDTLDASLAGQRLLQSAISSRLTGLAQRLDVSDSRCAAWMQGLGRQLDQRTSQGLSGYDASYYGLVGGIDAVRNPDLTVGVSFGSLTTDVTSEFGRTDVESVFASAYGTHRSELYQITGHLAGSLDAYESMRVVQVATLNSRPTGGADGWGINTGASLSHTLWAGDTFSLEPVVGMTYFRVNRDAFQESEGGSEALSVSDSSRTSFRSRIGTTLSWRRSILTGTASLEWSHEFLDESAAITSSISGSTFPVRSAAPGRNFFDMDVGLAGEVATGIWLSGNYLLTAAESFTSQSGLAQVQFLW